LEQAQQVLTGDAGLLVRLGVDELELLLEQAVDAAALLLLAQLEQVLAVADATAAVLAGRVRTALDRAAHRLALRAFGEQLHALAPAQPAHRSRVTRHRSDPPPLGLAATVVRDRRDVLDPDDLDTRVLDRPDGGLPTGTGALHHHVDAPHAVLHRAPRRG